MDADTDVLRDVADAWHRRPAVTLTASSALSWAASLLIHHGSPL